MWWWIAFSIGSLLVLFVLISKLEIHIEIKKASEDDRVSLYFRGLYGLVRYQYIVPTVTFRGWWEGVAFKSNLKSMTGGTQAVDHTIDWENIKQSLKQYISLLHKTIGLKTWFKRFLARVHCRELQWQTAIGTHDAAETAIAVGGIWFVKSSLLGYIFQFISLDTQPNIKVQPYYNQPLFLTNVQIKLSVQTGVFLVSIFRLMMRVGKVKGGWRTWKQILLRRKLGT